MQCNGYHWLEKKRTKIGKRKNISKNKIAFLQDQEKKMKKEKRKELVINSYTCTGTPYFGYKII